jgi:hypothetical protein
MFDPTSSLLKEHFTTLKNHNHQNYHNIMYYRTLIYHLI